MKELEQKLYDLGIDKAAFLPVEKIRFEPSLIELCQANYCGNYSRNWACPPLVGNTEELIKEAKAYKDIMVFQKVYALEDSFDIEGMYEGSSDFQGIVRIVHEMCEENGERYLLLGAGGCRYCEKCAAIDNEPCRFPKKRVASLESYGIQVSSLAEACGMKYINGVNTVTYFGGILF